MYAIFDTVAAADTLAFDVWADSTFNCHLTIEYEATLLTFFKIFEDCTVDTSDTLITWNINRASTNSAQTYLGQMADTSITAFGDSIIVQAFGGAAAKTEKQTYSFILKPKVHYAIEFISGANSNVISVFLKWYEHTDIH